MYVSRNMVTAVAGVVLALLCVTARAEAKTAPDAKAIKSLDGKSFLVPGMKGMRMIRIEAGTFTMGSPSQKRQVVARTKRSTRSQSPDRRSLRR